MFADGGDAKKDGGGTGSGEIQRAQSTPISRAGRLSPWSAILKRQRPAGRSPENDD